MSESPIDEEYAGDREDPAPYRSPSVLAILTLALGGLGFLALFKPTLWVFPLIAIAVGFAALYNLAKNPLKVGRKAALIGMALALFFFTWSVSHYFSREIWLEYHARQYADGWLELLRARELREAHQLHLRKLSRAVEGVTLDDYYANHPYAQSDFRSFFEREPLKTLLGLDPSVKIVFEQVGQHATDVASDTLTLNYLALYEKNGQPQQLPLGIVMLRERDEGTGQFRWCVDAVAPPTPRR